MTRTKVEMFFVLAAGEVADQGRSKSGGAACSFHERGSDDSSKDSFLRLEQSRDLLLVVIQ